MTGHRDASPTQAKCIGVHIDGDTHSRAKTFCRAQKPRLKMKAWVGWLILEAAKKPLPNPKAGSGSPPAKR